jgi:hypothetical protein
MAWKWKGGRTIDSRGYVRVLSPNHPDRDVQNYVYEHRLVMEKVLGRRLEPGEVVHHIDGDPANNAPENLMLFESQAAHQAWERKHGKRAVTETLTPGVRAFIPEAA